MINWFIEKIRWWPKRWFTSDTHYSHTNVISYCNRPFKDSHEMNKAMTKEWNSKVKPFDTIYHIGDFSMPKKCHESIVPKLNGKKFLISGNHDPSFIGHKKHQTWIDKLKAFGWEEVYPHNTHIFLKNGMQVQLCHLPFKPKIEENYDLRYMELRPYNYQYTNVFLIHGHIHGRYKKNGNQIDVSWDAHGGKITSEDELIAIINDPRDFIPSPLTEYYKLNKEKLILKKEDNK